MIRALLLLALLAGCGGAGVQAQARVSNAIATAANRALPPLVAAMEAECNGAIDAAHDAAAAEAALAACVARWRPVWGDCGARAAPGCRGGAWHALRRAQGRWADLIARQRGDGGVGARELLDVAAALREAWCGLRAALPPSVALPDLPEPVACAADGGAHG